MIHAIIEQAMFFREHFLLHCEDHSYHFLTTVQCLCSSENIYVFSELSEPG